MDIEAWLRCLRLEQYAAAFAEHDIDAETLVKLTGDDLKEIGVTSIGHRRRLLDAIADLGTDTDTSAPLGAVPESAPRAERRQLTVMFCDLVGSTALAEELDPEVMREIIRTYQKSVSGEIARFDGHVAKFMGDGILAYFGWPHAHEDDAERAVRSGLNITKAIRRQETPSGAPLQVRVGIATGLVVVGDQIGEGGAREEAVVGGTPNLAARLQGLAAGDSVAIAESTRMLLGERFAYEDLGKHRLRGFAEPVQAWRVIRSVETESRFAANRGARLTPLVGRGEELSLLGRRWGQVKLGKGQVALLAGEPGIGKSRIAHSFYEQIADDPHVRLLYQCSPYHTNSALYPFIRQIERAARFEREDTDEQKLDKLEALLAKSTEQLSKAASLIAPLLSIDSGTRYPPLTMSPQRQKEDTLRVLVEQLEGLAAQQPVLLVYEDVHWLDPTSQELLDLVVERALGLPVLVLITFRPDYAPPWSGQAHVSLLALNRLNRDLGASMVGELSGHKQLPREVLEQIVVKTDGIPLFVEELTKTVLESELLEAVEDRYVLAGDLPEHAIPASLKDSLMARLDRLAPIKEVAQTGAVIGREFSYELLAEVSTLSDEELDAALERLCHSELVFRRGVPPDARYIFKHALVQDAAYESLLKSRRRQLHARIGKAIEDEFPERVEVEPELLAHHYTEAGLRERAVTYWRCAGERAVAQSAHVEAIEHFNKGLAVLHDLPEGPQRGKYELTLRIALGPSLIAIKGYASPEARDSYVRARSLWNEVGEPLQLCPILYGLWGFHATSAELTTALNLGWELLEAAERVQEPGFVLDAHLTLSCTSFFMGNFALACEYGQRGRTLHVPQRHRAHGLQNPGAICRLFDALSLWCLGYPDQALARADETLRLTEELSHPFTSVVVLTWLAMLSQCRRDATQAQTLAEQATNLSQEQGFMFWFAAATMVRGWAMAAQGQRTAGSAEILSGLAALQATGSRTFLPYGLYLVAEMHRQAGNVIEAQEVLTDALAISRENSERYWEAELHRLQGQLLLGGSKNNRLEAETCFKQAIEVARSQQAQSLELRAAMSLCRLWQQEGKRDRAYGLLAEVYGWFTEGFDTPDLQEARALLQEFDHS